MAIWEWALSAYARPDVSEACLALQDDHGQNVSLLLWAVWAETSDARLLASAAQTARAWEARVLAPIREIRRRLKPSFPPIDERAREGLREDIKDAELRAERVLLETFEHMTERPGGTPALEALRAASRAWGKPASDDALARLARALS